jgi:hypothetical protein
MAKRKNSPALFEVISQDRSKQGRKELKVPGYARRQEPAETGEAAVEGQWEATGAAEQTEPTHEPRATAPRSRPEPVAGAAEPLIRTEGGRLRVSLNYVSCSVALGAGVLLLVLAFVLGRASISPERSPMSGETVAAGMGAETEQPAGDDASEQAAGAVASRRIAGRQYLVIESMGGLTAELRNQADEIARYCTDVGHPATVAQSSTEYLVWSLEGFDSADSEEARGYAAQIHELGKRYRALPGAKHDFNQRDESGLLKPRFEPAS